ncbi:hypothetical protein H2200_005216 [Cladophialophora chaetospira]|uniref:Acyltransferase 3 domain-containing protein n=1 Tax=Cladophialophora chaetospira TaxID=386627 RepID=A0AA39CIR0_9EURO|nr:hypothetical protein H2200_005216 [Cladophialophora chaetospira]
MGLVNALKPLQLARSDQVDKALQKLASSSFSRIFRLVLPATAATIISWLICNLGFYATAAQSDAFWLHTNTPKPSKNGYEAVGDLLYGLKATWIYRLENPYDQPQWALIYLLQGSIMIISALSLVVTMTSRWRTVTLFLLTCWSLDWSGMLGDPLTGFCCFLGIVLAECNLSNIPRLIAPYSPFVSPPTILLSLFLMSYPASYPETAFWSTWLRDIARNYFPVTTLGVVERLYGSIGGVLLIAAIIISPHARWALSRKPLLWLGKASFAIYLLHGMFLRTVFAWILHLGQSKVITTKQADDGFGKLVEHYPLPGTSQRVLATVVMGVCVAIASHFWNSKLEPVFAKITSKLEGIVSGNAQIKDSLSNTGPLLPLRKD